MGGTSLVDASGRWQPPVSMGIHIIDIYRILNGLLFISGLRGLMGSANRSSSFASSPPPVLAAAAEAAPLPTIASREATPPPLEPGKSETPVAGGERDVIKGCVRGSCWLFAAVGGVSDELALPFSFLVSFPPHITPTGNRGGVQTKVRMRTLTLASSG
jgi:hypothetical protein